MPAYVGGNALPDGRHCKVPQSNLHFVDLRVNLQALRQGYSTFGGLLFECLQTRCHLTETLRFFGIDSSRLLQGRVQLTDLAMPLIDRRDALAYRGRTSNRPSSGTTCGGTTCGRSAKHFDFSQLQILTGPADYANEAANRPGGNCG